MQPSVARRARFVISPARGEITAVISAFAQQKTMFKKTPTTILPHHLWRARLAVCELARIC